MGSQESKTVQPSNQENVKETVLNESAPSTPILTPLDPRSPSVNIARTPLEVILGEKIIKDSPDDLEVDNDGNKEVVKVVLGIDPRSPTVEFNRTPIIVETVAKNKSKLHNKNLINVLKSEIQTTPVGSTKKSPGVVPPKLLEVSPVSIVSNYNKRKSFVGLLETNVDFTETDLDKVCQTKNDLNQSLPVQISEELPSNKLEEQMEALKVETDCEDIFTEKFQDLEDKESELSSEKILEEKTINITAQVKDFDKKLTNLIYEDDSDDDNKVIKVSKIKDNGNRTPLGVRNSNEDPKKKNRLKVSDKPRKSEISKIPVFKDCRKKMGVQCENTPPTKMSQWDADKTLII